MKWSPLPKRQRKKENETQPKHSKANILTNIETNISTSNNTEYVTYNHLKQIRSKHTDLTKSSQTWNVSFFKNYPPVFIVFTLIPSSEEWQSYYNLSWLTVFRKNYNSIRINQNKEIRQEFQNWLTARRNYQFFLLSTDK